MKTARTTTIPDAPAPLASWQRMAQIFALNVMIWSVLSALGALTSLNDDLRSGVQGEYWLIFLSWGSSAMALALLSFVLYLCFSRWPQVLSSGKNIALGYGLLLLVLLPLQLLYVAQLFIGSDAQDMSWAAMQEQVDNVGSLLRLSSSSAVYFAVAAVKIWQQSQARGLAWVQAQADSLSLRLELEHQRLLALRAQLEPHFVFNALNAISALVMTDRKDVALRGIHGLSDLLRYAMQASEKNWVRFSDELSFVQDYLALQRLRYGARLQVHIEGADALTLAGDCPPLLLQPLIENALRHDLDCHEEPSDIQMRLQREGQDLIIHISNPVHAEAAKNPGAGLGLRNTRARLQLMYADRASLQTQIVAGRFQVEVRLPLHAPELT